MLKRGLIFIFILFSLNAHAMEYYLIDKTIYVDTVYSDPFGSELVTHRDWMIVPEKDKTLVFYTIDNYQNSKKYCELSFVRKSDVTIKILKNSENKIIEKSDLSLFPPDGYPAPCRIVDFSSISLEDNTLNTIQNAGGRRFKQTYFYLEEQISFEDAIKNGWIKITDKELEILDKKEEMFKMIQVFDDKQKFFLMQLWNYKDSSWWIYEKTNFSQSWRK